MTSLRSRKHAPFKVQSLEHALTEKEEYINSIQTLQNDQKIIQLSPGEFSRDETMRKLTYDIIEFNTQLQQRDQFIAHQQETIDFLQDSLQVKHSELQSMKSMKEKADDEIKQLQNKVAKLEDDLNNTNQTTEEMRNRLNVTCRTIFSELKGRFDEYCKQASSQIESAEMLKDSNIQLSELVAQLQEKYQLAQNEAADLQKTLEKQEVDIKMLSSDLTKIEDENSTLITKVSQQNDKIQDLIKAIEVKNTDLLEKKLDFEGREKQYLIKIEDLSSALQTIEEDKTQLKLELDLSANELNKEKKLNAMYCLRLEDLKAIIRKKINEKRLHDEENQEMKKLFKDSKAEQRCLEKELSKLKEKESLDVLKDSVWTQHPEQSKNEVDKLTCILNGLKSDVNYSKKFLENERIHHCETNRRLKSAYSLLGAIKCQLTEKENVISSLRDSLTVANTKANQHKQRVRDLESCVDRYQEEMTNLKTVLTKTLTEQAEAEEESCRKTEEIKSLHLEMNDLKCEKENKIREHLRVKNNLETELVRVRHDLQNAIEEFKKLKQSSFQKIFSRSENKEEICRLKHIISERQYQLQQKEKELQAVNCYKKELQELVEDKNTQLSDLSNAVKTLQQEHDKTSKEFVTLSNKNKQLESYCQHQKQEVTRLQKMLCDFQLNKNQHTDQQNTWDTAETQKSLETQRKMTYTLIQQLNSAQSKISTLNHEKKQLEKRIGELKSLNGCLGQEIKQIKDTPYYNEDSDSDRIPPVPAHKHYREQHFQDEDHSNNSTSKMFDPFKEKLKGCKTWKQNKDVTVGRFGRDYYLEEQKTLLQAQYKSFKRFPDS